MEHAVVGHNASNDDGIVGNEFLSLIDGSLQRSDGSLQGLLGLLDVSGSLKGGIDNLGNSLVGILVTLQGFSFVAEFLDGLEESSKLHILNFALSAIVLQLEVIPYTPDGCISLVLGTNGKSSIIFYLHE